MAQSHNEIVLKFYGYKADVPVRIFQLIAVI